MGKDELKGKLQGIKEILEKIVSGIDSTLDSLGIKDEKARKWIKTGLGALVIALGAAISIIAIF